MGTYQGHGEVTFPPAPDLVFVGGIPRVLTDEQADALMRCSDLVIEPVEQPDNDAA